jgi:hypothetical protein
MRKPWRCRPKHIRRYLRIGEAGYEKLLNRAGLGNLAGETWLSRSTAKRLMRYHFVMLAEKKPTKWKKNSRYQQNRGKAGTDVSLRRSVHPRLQSLTD